MNQITLVIECDSDGKVLRCGYTVYSEGYEYVTDGNLDDAIGPHWTPGFAAIQALMSAQLELKVLELDEGETF